MEIEPSNEHGFNLDDGNMCRILYLLQHETYLLFLNKHPDFAFYTFDSARAAPLLVPGPVQYCPDVAEAEIAANFAVVSTSLLEIDICPEAAITALVFKPTRMFTASPSRFPHSTARPRRGKAGQFLGSASAACRS